MSTGFPMQDLFDVVPASKTKEPLATGAWVLRAYAQDLAPALLQQVERVTAAAPFRHLTTPGDHVMSVAMSNCGALGWVSDRSGYRYDPVDPITGQPWPPMPPLFAELAREAATEAGYCDYRPDACLINRYRPGARLSLHCDQDEDDAFAPIVSVSIGAPAKSIWGGLQRKDKTRRIPLLNGDVVVWGGESRFVYHGVAPLAEYAHPLTGCIRINLTFRKVK